MSTNDPVTLELLPLELKEEIFDYLQPSELLKLALTSKELNYCIGVSSKLMDKFEVKMSKIRKGIVCDRMYTRVSVDHIITNFTLKMTVEKMPYFKECVKKLIIPCEILWVMSKSVAGKKFFEMCESVEEMTILRALYEPYGKRGDLTECLPNLQKLNFHQYHCNVSLPKMLKVTEISFHNILEFNQLHFENLGSDVQKLEICDVEYQHYNGFDHIDSINFNRLANLRVLILRNCFLRERLSIKSLDSLKIIDCDVGVGFNILPEQCEIAELHIENCRWFLINRFFWRQALFNNLNPDIQNFTFLTNFLDIDSKLKKLSLINLDLSRNFEHLIAQYAHRLESLIIKDVRYRL